MAESHVKNPGQVFVFALDLVALKLHRRSQLVVFGCQKYVDQPEFLYLLDRRETAVRLFHLAFDQVLDLGVCAQGFVVGKRDTLFLRVFFNVFVVDHDQHAQVFALVPDDHRIRNIGREFELVFQLRRRNVLAACGDDDVLLALD